MNITYKSKIYYERYKRYKIVYIYIYIYIYICIYNKTTNYTMKNICFVCDSLHTLVSGSTYSTLRFIKKNTI